MLFQLLVAFVLCACAVCHQGSLCGEDDEPVSLLQSSLSSSSSSATRGEREREKVSPMQGPKPAAYTADDDRWAVGHCFVKDAVVTNIDSTRKPVMWVHIHKSAGTAMCCEARRRERVVTPSMNCNRLAWPGEGNPTSRQEAADRAAQQAAAEGKPQQQVAVAEEKGAAWYELKKSMKGWALDGHQAYRHRPSWTTCRERAAFMQDYNFTWSAIARELVDGDVCTDSFMYGTILRKPLDTAVSSLKFEGHRMAPLEDILGCIQNRSCSPADKDGGDQWKIFDNFIVRTLGGFDAMVAPAGGVNSSHYSNAKKVLMSFELVVLHARLQEIRSIQAMDRLIGWHLPEENKANAASEATSPISPQQSQQLQQINTLDYRLYELAEKTYYS